MKRRTRSSSSGGRLRLVLPLAALVALFALLPVASASAANPTASLTIAGSGSGKVVGVGETPGNPAINCEYASPGPQTGTCAAETQAAGPFKAVKLRHEAAPGSTFVEWKIEQGVHNETYCAEESAGAGDCSAIAVGAEEVKVKAVFEAEEAPNVHILMEGSGSGSIVSEEGELEGTPPIDCQWDGSSQTGTCDAVNGSEFGGALLGIAVVEEAAPGSVFGGWTLEEGELGYGCQYEVEPGLEEEETACSVFIFGEEEIVIKAVFNEAPPAPNVHILMEGSGSGSIVSEEGELEGTPPIDCQWDGSSQTGTCDAVNGSEFGGALLGIAVIEEPAPGSVFGGWTLEEGELGYGCQYEVEPGLEEEETACSVFIFGEEEIVIKAAFEPEAAPEPVTLTVNPASVGNVHSYPTGAINCSSTASNCTQEYLEGEEATMVATQPSGTVFTGWNGCEGAEDIAEGRICHITMDGNSTLEATYSSTYLLSAEVTGTGIGNVHSSPFGINCGAGLPALPTTPPANKSASPPRCPRAPRSPGAGNATRSGWPHLRDRRTDRAQNVHATYTQLQLLKVTHAGTGGNVHSYPNAINCGAGSLCSAYFATGTHVTLVATQPSGTTFEGWSGRLPAKSPAPATATA